MASNSTPQNMKQIEDAMAELSPLTTPHIRRRLFTRYTKNISTYLIDNATASTSPQSETPRSFELFNKLPAEIRLKIWRSALQSSRIIELIQKPSTLTTSFPYKQALTPAIFFVNRESQAETLSVYKAHLSEEPFKWMRFEQDIFHVKDLSLSRLYHNFRRPPHNMQISRWNASRRNPAMLLGSDKWHSRPEGFDTIRALAISRDILVHLDDDYEAVIRHFFPNLLVLIVLIDDESNIEDTWGIWDIEYGKYEELQEGQIPRLEFAKKCKGPFKEVKTNQDYQMGVEFEIRKHFSREEKDYPSYLAPRIKVMGALLEEGVEIAGCGKLPTAPSEKRKDPFTDFGDVQGGWLYSRLSRRN